MGFERKATVQGWAPYLDPDERMLWEGAPMAGFFRLAPRDALLIPFSLFWGGFALFWNISAWQAGSPLFFRLFGLPFLVVGFYVTIGRFFHAAARRKKTVYALSTRRAFIATSLFGKKLREMPLTPNIEIEMTPERGGSITLGPKATRFNPLRGWWSWSGQTDDFTFEHLEKPDAVYQSIRKIQKGGA